MGLRLVLMALFLGILGCRSTGNNASGEQPARDIQGQHTPDPKTDQKTDPKTDQKTDPKTDQKTDPKTDQKTDPKYDQEKPIQGGKPAQKATTSPGCGKQLSLHDAEDKEINVAKRKRVYLFVPPKSYDPNQAHKVVFWYHGAGASPELTRGVPNYNHSPNLEKIAGKDTFFIHPRQIPGMPITWDHSVPGQDVSMFDALYDELSNTYCIDPKRVFIIGVSNGALFVNLLANARPEKIKGAVAVAMPGLGAGWQKVAMPSMLIQDDRDAFGSAQASARKMASDQGCQADTTDLRPKAPNQCVVFKECKTPVAFCPWQVLPGWNPHDWPRYPKADEQIWDFLNPAVEPQTSPAL